MVNNNCKKTEYDKNAYRAVETATSITCSKCGKTNLPSVEEISIKSPNYYYKNCKVCRNKMSIYAKKYIEKNLYINKNI